MDSTHETTAELFTSRPAPEERLEKELLCYDLLEKYKIPYTGLDHPAAMSVEDCHNADVLLGIHICKNLFLFSDVRGCSSFLIKSFSKLTPGKI